MPDEIEENLLKLLNNKSLAEITPELCDFTLEEQNSAIEAQGIQPTTSSDFIPIVGKSVTYIVACVLINDCNEVLMMQEAKESCAGKWYLPAGRMEPKETIIEAAIREAHEETGLDVEITTLLAIEAAGGTWFRFVLTGKVIGGELKTPARADKESLQAKWILNVNELSLRATDILQLIEIGRNYRNHQDIQYPWHGNLLPGGQSHYKNYLRVIVAIRKRSNNALHVLVSEKNVYHFPTVEINPGRSIHSTLRKFMIELFGAELPQHRPHGALSIEHCPSPSPYTTDGICLTILVVFRPPLEEVSLIGKCAWHELSKPNGDKLAKMITNKNSTLPLLVIR